MNNKMKKHSILIAAMASFLGLTTCMPLIAQEPPVKLTVLKNGEIAQEPYYMDYNDIITLRIMNTIGAWFRFGDIKAGLVFGFHEQVSQRIENTAMRELSTPEFLPEPEITIRLVDLFGEEFTHPSPPTQLIITVFKVLEKRGEEEVLSESFTLGKEYSFWIMGAKRK
jgi:hypothetical protein